MNSQLDLFSKPAISLDKPLRVITLFSGYGSQEMALERMGIPFEIWGMCEFDKYACSLYNAAHDTNFKTTDVRDIKGGDLNVKECDKYDYLLTYSFP